MINKIYTLVLLCLVTLFASCSKSKIEYKSEYERSFDAWVDFKSRSGNNYQYVVHMAGVFEFSGKTTITVSGGKVVSRKFSLYMMQGNGQQVLQNEWTEDQNAINSHTEGAAPITLDEVYSRAKNDWLKKRKDVTVFFETKNNGMISSAGYVPNGCMDDCFTGVRIASIVKN